MRKTNPSQTLMKLSIIAIILGLLTLPCCTALGLCHCDIDNPYLGDNGKCYSSDSQCENDNSGMSCYYCGL